MIRQRKIELLAPAKIWSAVLQLLITVLMPFILVLPVSEHVRLRGIHWRILLSWCGTLMYIMSVSM